MKRENDSTQVFSRRAFIIGALQGSLLCVLGGRLAWLQVSEGQRYKTLAESNRINIKMLAPARGLIVDRYGAPLAVNGQNFRALIVPERTPDLATALSRLQKIIPLTQRDIQRVLKLAEKNPSFMPIEVKDNLEWEEVAGVEVNLPDLPGVSIDEGEIRHYPLGHATAHLIGYVGAVSKAEQGDDPLLTLPGFTIGKTGIEKTFDGTLRGTAGSAQVEVNVLGREVRELSRRPGRQGGKVALTIDAELQNYVHERLAKERSASAVIMDVHTGAVYALSSHPAFDPNVFARGIPADLWEELLADAAHPLNNKAAGGQYPPGSTFKMVTAMAGLERNVISPYSTVFCPGHYDLGKTRFHCWKKGGHGTVDVVKAITESCDTFFYKMANDLGIDNLAEYAHKFGFGAKLGLELPEERAGIFPTKEWKKKRMNDIWHPGETVVAVIGQGYTTATPLQLAVMTSRLVNGGFAVNPWIATTEENPWKNGEEWPHMGLKKENLDLIGKGMMRVVNMPGGTAHGSMIKEENFAMGGKTGTAQVKRITKEERARGVKNETLAWHLRHHALFVGYAPLHDPRYACAVVVEHGVGGSTAAAPIARDILLMAQQRDPATKVISAFGMPEKKGVITPGRKPASGLKEG